MHIQQLIQTLEQKVQQLYQAYLPQQDEKIVAKFDRTLFNENGQPVRFYLHAIQQTLNQIKALKSDEPQHYRFITERLLAQCTALSEALNRKNKSAIRKTVEKPIPRQQHSIHKLPPRERLEKYYEALEQLNALYQEHKDLARTANTNDEQLRYTALATRYKERRQKCQDAIDLLEEYLAFKEEQEKGDSAISE